MPENICCVLPRHPTKIVYNWWSQRYLQDRWNISDINQKCAPRNERHSKSACCDFRFRVPLLEFIGFNLNCDIFELDNWSLLFARNDFPSDNAGAHQFNSIMLHLNGGRSPAELKTVSVIGPENVSWSLIFDIALVLWAATSRNIVENDMGNACLISDLWSLALFFQQVLRPRMLDKRYGCQYEYYFDSLFCYGKGSYAMIVSWCVSNWCKQYVSWKNRKWRKVSGFQVEGVDFYGLPFRRTAPFQCVYGEWHNCYQYRQIVSVYSSLLSCLNRLIGAFLP